MAGPANALNITASGVVQFDGINSFSAPSISQYGVVLGLTGNNIVTLAPDASTTKVLVSGGASANPSWQAIGSGALALGSFGSTPNSSGASLSGGTLTLQPADGSNPGGVSTASQSFGGAKVFVISATSPIFGVLSGGGGTSQIQYPSSATNYNFNLASTAGTTGQFLTSGGGGSTAMTWTTPSSIIPSTITVTNTTTNSTFYPTFINNSITGTYALDVSANLSMNPSTGNLTASGTITGQTALSSPSILLTGSSSGTISILPQTAAGTFNFNLPTTAGTSGFLLTSAGGVGAPMTWTDPTSITGITTVGNVTSGHVAFDGTVGTTLTSTTAGFTLAVTPQGAGNNSSGGNVIISAGEGGSLSTGGSGGGVTLEGKDGIGAGTGGSVTLNSGDGGLTGNGAAITLNAGNAGPSGNHNGGGISINSGDSNGTGAAGAISINAGDATTGNGSGGTIGLRGGVGNGTQVGGSVSILGGSTNNTGAGGLVLIAAGQSSDTGKGGSATIRSGYGGGNSGDGGDVTITTGFPGTDGIAGNIYIGQSNGEGTDKSGTTTNIYCAVGTGTGAVGKVKIFGDSVGSASGSAYHTDVSRLLINGSVALTTTVAATIATLTLASNSSSGGCITYLVECTDGTDFQSASGIVSFSAINKAGTKSGSTAPQDESQTRSTGTLTNVFSVTSGGLVQITSTTSLTPTFYRITYEISCLSAKQTITVP